MIKFSDVSLDYKSAISDLSSVLKSRWLTSGKVVSKLENKINKFNDSSFTALVSNCTSALHLALICNNIKKNDEVIVPSFTWISSINAILMVGAKPIIVDVDIKTMNISPEIIQKNINKKTKAIMVVHQFGNPCDMTRINKIARKNNIPIVEDSACAMGAKYSDGKYVGNSKNLNCFSLHPRKIITTGEGGFLTSNSKKYEKRIRILLNHGHKKNQSDDYFEEMGFNYRLSDIQAAIALSQIQHLRKMIKERKELSKIYKSEITRKGIFFQDTVNKCQSSWQSFVIHTDDPDDSKKIVSALEKNNILLRKKYYLGHEQKFLKKYSKGSLANCEKINQSIVFLPMHNRLSKYDTLKISKIINSI